MIIYRSTMIKYSTKIKKKKKHNGHVKICAIIFKYFTNQHTLVFKFKLLIIFFSFNPSKAIVT